MKNIYIYLYYKYIYTLGRLLDGEEVKKTIKDRPERDHLISMCWDRKVVKKNYFYKETGKYAFLIHREAQVNCTLEDNQEINTNSQSELPVRMSFFWRTTSSR